MQSNKFLKIAEKIAKRDKALFDALIEFEKTKRIRTKERLNFTIDRSVAERFKKFCRDKGYNMSAKIEQAMKEIIG
jgi:hypothetical protein